MFFNYHILTTIPFVSRPVSPWCHQAVAAGETCPILKQPAMDFEPRVGASADSNGPRLTPPPLTPVDGWLITCDLTIE